VFTLIVSSIEFLSSVLWVQGVYRLGFIFLWAQVVGKTENDSCSH